MDTLTATSGCRENIKVFEDLAAAARRRKATFKSRQDAAQRYRTRRPFNTFSQGCFQQYVQHGFTQLPGQFTCAHASAFIDSCLWRFLH